MAMPDKATVNWALFGLRGRIARQTYILGQLFMIAIFAVIVARLIAVEGDEGATAFWGLIMLVALLGSAWSMIALTVKRLNDINQPGVLALLLFVPTVNMITVVALMFWPSHPQANRHGPPPFGPSEGSAD